MTYVERVERPTINHCDTDTKELRFELLKARRKRKPNAKKRPTHKLATIGSCNSIVALIIAVVLSLVVVFNCNTLGTVAHILIIN